METTTLNIKQKPMSFEKKETSINSDIFKSLITNAAKNLELFCLTLSNAKEKFKNEADSFMQHLRKSEENINKLIEEKTKYYDSIKEKVKVVFDRRDEQNLEDLDLNEDPQIKQIVYECNDLGNFFRYFKTIDEEIKSLESLKENKSLREYVENTKSFLEQAGLGDLVTSKGLFLEGGDANLENPSFANAPTDAGIPEKSKNPSSNKPKNAAVAFGESSSVSSEPEKFANKYLKSETPSSNKFLGKKRLHSSDAEVESTNTNNQDEIDVLKDSEENSANDDQKKNEKAKVSNEKANSNNISKDSNTSAKKSNRYAMKREILALGLTTNANSVQTKKPNAPNSNANSGSNNNKNQSASGAGKEHSKEKKEAQDLANQNSSNSVYSDTIDLVSSSNANLNTNNSNTNANRTRNFSAANANSNSKSKTKGGKTSIAPGKPSTSDLDVVSKENQSVAKQTNLNSLTGNLEKQIPIVDNPVVKTQKYIDNSTELYKNIDTLIGLIKRDKHNYLDYILKNFEESLFKQRIFYCEFDMLNKNRKCTSDLLGKDPIFENSENYEYVKLTIVRKGKQNINNLLKSMENFFKQYIKRKDIDGSAVIKGSLNCSFDKLQKYFTMQMRSFEYCEAIQLEVYLFKWDLFYDYEEKDDKINIDTHLAKQYKNFGVMLRETRILEKKRSIMLKMNEGEVGN